MNEFYRKKMCLRKKLNGIRRIDSKNIRDENKKTELKIISIAERMLLRIKSLIEYFSKENFRFFLNFLNLFTISLRRQIFTQQ